MTYVSIHLDPRLHLHAAHQEGLALEWTRDIRLLPARSMSLSAAALWSGGGILTLLSQDVSEVALTPMVPQSVPTAMPGFFCSNLFHPARLIVRLLRKNQICRFLSRSGRIACIAGHSTI